MKSNQYLYVSDGPLTPDVPFVWYALRKPLPGRMMVTIDWRGRSRGTFDANLVIRRPGSLCPVLPIGADGLAGQDHCSRVGACDRSHEPR